MNDLDGSQVGSHGADEQAQVDRHWMDHALRLADKAEALDEVPVGAVVVCDGKVVGEGWNQPITACDPSAHAEIMALRQAARALENYRLPSATLYVTIEPCTMCAGAIVHARIKRLVFGAAEPKSGALVSNAQVFDSDYVNHRVDYCGGVADTACRTKMSDFFKRRRAEKKAKRLAGRMSDSDKSDSQ